MSVLSIIFRTRHITHIFAVSDRLNSMFLRGFCLPGASFFLPFTLSFTTLDLNERFQDKKNCPLPQTIFFYSRPKKRSCQQKAVRSRANGFSTLYWLVQQNFIRNQVESPSTLTFIHAEKNQHKYYMDLEKFKNTHRRQIIQIFSILRPKKMVWQNLPFKT